MRVVKNMLQTFLHFLLVFGVIALLVFAFLYANPGDEQQDRVAFRLEPNGTPITLDEYRTILEPENPDPRYKEYYYPQTSKLRNGNHVLPSVSRYRKDRDDESDKQAARD